MAEEHARLSVAGQELEVVSLDGEEAPSRLFRLDVVCRSVRGGLSPSAVLGNEAELTLFDSFERARTITGVVADVGNAHHDDGSTTVRLVIRPAAYLLSLGCSCRAYVDKSVVDIVDQVVAGVPHRWELSSSYAPRAYTQQYREDDWTFVSRQLESEGIYYWFDHGAGSQLVLTDDSAAAPELHGGAYIEFALERGMSADGERIEQLGEVATLGPSKFTVRSFNPLKPDLLVEGSSGSGGLEIYDAPGGGPDAPGECARQASIVGAASAGSGAGVAGQASSVRIAPGMVLQVGNHPLSRLDGRYFVTSCRYRVRQRRRDQTTDERPYTCWFEALPTSMSYRPPRLSPAARQSGLQSGVVGGPPGEEIYPNDMGEVRVQLHWDREGGRDDRSGKWMRVAQRGAHDSLQLPRIGWNVLTFNDEGAPDAPSVLSRIHDAEHPPAYKLPDNMTRVVFKTATSPADGSFNEIYFEDRKGNEEMFINASRDETILVQNAKNEDVWHDSYHRVGNDHSLTVGMDSREIVGNDQTVVVDGDEKTQISGATSTTVEGNLTISIGGKLSETTGDADAVSVKNTRNVSVGAAIVDTCLGNISADGSFLTILAGGAHLKLSAKSITEDVGGASVQTIGGIKLESAKKNRVLDIKKHLLETVGGALIAKSEGAYIDGSTKATSWTVGGMLSGKAPVIILEGYEKITLKCGGSSLVVTKDCIEFTAPKFDLGDASHLETLTGKIEHN